MTQGIGGLQSVLQCYNAKSSIAFLPIGSLRLHRQNASDRPIFCSILPISLQPIAYEKIHALHSNELAKGYTFISITIFIDKYLLRDIVKLVV